MRSELKKTKRLVIKLGTNILCKDNEVDKKYIQSLAKQISILKQNKKIDVVIVSSGAVGLGIKTLGLDKLPKTLPEKQAAAAIGQSRLMHMYNNEFDKKKLVTAQILITQEDLRNRDRYTNAKNTLNTLLAEDVIPIVNENDTVSVDEIKVGDNDTLSAYITNLINADLLLILTSVDGFLDYDKMEVISEITSIDKRIEAYIRSAKTSLGTGGMVTKINAAKIVNKCGEWMVIANGREKNIVQRILAGDNLGTIFKPAEKKMASKKRWLAFNKNIKGTVHVDRGAKDALITKGKSLLPIGITKIEGTFLFGDLISIVYNKEEIARGIVNYSSEQLTLIKGLKTSHIVKKLGSLDYKEVIHRDNMVIL